MKKKVLIITSYYIPSMKGGGPVQSIKNLVDNLSDKIDFYIITADRDLGDSKPFDNIKVDSWIHVGRANVYYTNKNLLTFNKLKNLMCSINYDAVYLNSFFAYKDSILPIILRKLNKVPNKPFILAPRGEFSPGALGLKRTKKQLYINIVKMLGLYNNIKWHATAESEKRDIERIFGKDLSIIVANNLTTNYNALEYSKNIEKSVGELKIAFISRVHPKKNLKKAIEFLQQIKGKVEYNIYGPLEDKKYWSECEEIIKKLPANITVNYKGLLTHDKVMGIFNKHHIFLFPTLGENFGHVISEALIGGCPVIISDQTPWRDLEKNQVGWDINLKCENNFIKAIQMCTDMDQNEYDIFSRNAFQYGKNKSNNEKDILNTYRLFF